MRSITYLLGLFLVFGALFADDEAFYREVFGTNENGAYVKSGTPKVLELMRNRENLSPHLRALLDEKLSERPTRSSFLLTPHFKIHYNTTDCDTTYARRCGEFFETAWAAEIDSLGFLAPPSDRGAGGDNRYDVYITRFSYEVYGVTYPEYDIPGPSPWNDVASYIEVSHSYAGFPDNDDPEGSAWGAFKVTAAHELFHASQMAYDADEDIWLLEAGSVWMEDVVFDYVNDYLNYLDDFFETPWLSIMDERFRMYGSCVLNHCIAANYGGEFIRDYFGETIDLNGIPALEAAFGGRSSNAIDEFMRFFCWNFCVGTHSTAAFYEEANTYPNVVISFSPTSYPYSFTSTSSQAPRSYGANYVYLASPPEVLRVDFSSTSSAQWRLALVFAGTDAETARIENLPVDSIFLTGGRPCALVIGAFGAMNSTTSYNYTCRLSAIESLCAEAGSERIACDGESVELGGSPTAAGGAAPYTYAWSPAEQLDNATLANPTASPVMSMFFYVTVHDASGDSARDSVYVTVDPPIAIFAPSDTSILAGTSTTLVPTVFGGTEPYFFAWYPCYGLDDATARNPVASPETTTTYTVTVFDMLDCAQTDTVVVQVLSSIAEHNLPTHVALSAYPNPFNSCVKISVLSGSFVQICDFSGRCVFESVVKDGTILWQPKNCAAGVYTVKSGGNALRVLYLP